ncbi:PepSY-like domain-containing protein [Chitinophaga varians]|uniref:PepSY-like domain-containing protein n=1 Tax=Chitinophaga varians TaxID=2202339 RepID=UPI00165FCE95|nr:PepSY-like domain-containing protein [Chitinophaga varians]MBC9909687.1 PepSY-like domain-containing protein [Chitinophaga varians]
MKMYFLLGCLLVSASSFAQKISEAQVPTVVKTALAQKFPNATSVKWEMEKHNYEAGFRENNQHVSAVFDVKGNWMETETPIPASELPKAASAYIANHYKDAKIKETARIQHASGATNYEVEIKGKDIIFDNNGKVQ